VETSSIERSFIMPLNNAQIAVIGCGVMGEALIKGLLNQHLLPAQAIIASDVREIRGEQLVERYGVRFTTDNIEASRTADILVMAVKPQMMEQVLAGIKGQFKNKPLVLSIAAGFRIEAIREGCGSQCVVRAMPNTPGQIGQGMTVWTATSEVSDKQRTWAEAVLGALGQTLYVNDENFLDMATAINGTGPAYVFLLMEALIDAGVHLGFARHDSENLVLQTMRGSVEYAIASKLHPAQLRNQVTSPGGTSAAAIYQLEKGGIRTVISRAIWAAYRRSVELGRTKGSE
jgi:pyrroline-5-carboxylate reductase